MKTKLCSHLAMLLMLMTQVGVANEDPTESARARPYVATDRVVSVSGVSIPLYFASGSDQDSKVVVYEPPVMVKAKAIQAGGVERLVPITEVRNDGTLSIEVVWDVNGRATTARQIQEQIEKWDESQFLGVQDGNISPLYAARAWFEIEDVTGNTTLSKVRAENFFSVGAVPVHFAFNTEEHARRIAHQLQADFAPLRIRFRYAFDGALVESCVAKAESSSLQGTYSYNRLTGEGARAKVSRQQAISGAKEAIQSISISTRCAANLESDKSRLADVLQSRLNELQPVAESLNDSWEALGRYGFDPRDLLADVENVIKEERDSENKTVEKNVTDRDQEMSGSWEVKGNWGDVGSSISNSFKDKSDFFKEDLRERLARQGIATEWQGERLIPKTVNVITNDQIRGVFETDVQVSYERVVESSQTLKVDLDEHRMYVDENEAGKRAVQPLEHRIAMLSRRLEELEALGEIASTEIQRLALRQGDLRNYIDSTIVAEQKDLSSQLADYFNRGWRDFTNERKLNKRETNTLQYPIQVLVQMQVPTIERVCSIAVWVGNQRIVSFYELKDTTMHNYCTAIATVPPGMSYRFEPYTNRGEREYKLSRWYELTVSGE